MARPDMRNRPDRKIDLGFGDLLCLIGSGRRERIKGGKMVIGKEEFIVIDPGSKDDPVLVSRYEHNGYHDEDPESRLGPPTTFPQSKYYRISLIPQYLRRQQVEKALARDAGEEVDSEDREAVSRGIRRPRRTIIAPHKKSK